uniref:NADH-ubiquinone oxidoreductase chain 3 n=1 Tax=Histeromerus sp. QL-2013 TaxID=1421637 RepID=A0A0A6ZKV0_9HYME|nr:NADH dehydrogenase subunit 3 [Histeromerus sp. QL-2013]
MFLMMMVILIVLISFIMMLINLLISKKSILDREKMSSFECGFDPLSSSRLPFSIHFYMIAILFLIFDVEVVFLFPIVNSMEILNYNEWYYISMMILFILYLGLEFEKKEGSLKWFF